MNEKVCYIWLQQAVGPYSRLAREVLSRFENITDVYDCDDFEFLGEKRERYIKRLETKDMTEAFEVYKRCESMGVEITGYYSELYPKRLRDIEDPPAVLYSIGNLKNLDKIPCVAIVGSRNMTDYGKSITEELARTLAKNGICVVSGLAKGIDTAAHRGAVMADGYTVAVLGNPIGEVYPKENIRAFETLYKRGLVVSELYPGARRTRADFPNRNRIISGMSDAVVVTEAGESSGALITAHHALKQGKALYSVPGPVCEESAGSNRLIKQGATPLIEPADVIAPLALGYPDVLKQGLPSDTEKLGSYGNSAFRSNEKQKARKSAEELKRLDEESKAKEQIGEVKASQPEQKENNAEKVQSTEKNSAEPWKNEIQNGAPRFSDPVKAEKIIEVLAQRAAVTVDELFVKTGIEITELLAELTYMEIDGLVIATAGGRFTVSKFVHKKN